MRPDTLTKQIEGICGTLNSIFPDSTQNHIWMPKRPYVIHHQCVLAGNMRNSI